MTRVTSQLKEIHMKRQAFLTEEEIQARIAAEAASDKERKMTPEQLTAIYSI